MTDRVTITRPDLSKYPPGSVIPGDPKCYNYPEPETVEVKLLKEIKAKLDKLLSTTNLRAEVRKEGT